MARRRDVERWCSAQNQIRNVKPVPSASRSDFWNRAYGSFLIVGGSEPARTDMLASKLSREMSAGFTPTIVLTTSDSLERSMIARVQGGAPGFLNVSSPRYRNYHFFYHWAESDIARFLRQAADILGYSNPDMPIYINAFTHILSRCYPPSLASLLALSAYQDAEISQLGQRRGASSVSVQQILHYAQAGVMFRLLLEQLAEVFSPLTTRDCATGYNLSAIQPVPDGVYLVNIRAHEPALINAYFAAELHRTLSAGGGFRLVYSDLALQEQDPLEQTLLDAQAWSHETGLVHPNPGVPLGEQGAFDNRVILLDKSFPDGILETALRPLGTYTHYTAALAGGTPAKWLSFETSTNWTPTPEPGRLRVRPVDAAGYEAVLSGGYGNAIVLARTLRN